MADMFVLEVATPERMLIREHCTEAQIPGEAGYLGILPGHAPLLAELGIGVLTYTPADGRKRQLTIAGGFLEIVQDQVRVLAVGAEHPDDIDIARAQKAMERAAERLSHPELGIDVARALNAMKRARARLAVSGHDS